MAINVTQITSPSSYTPEELNLLNTSVVEASFNPSVNYIEYIITDRYNSFQLVDIPYNRYSFPTDGTVTSNFVSSINFDPLSDIKIKNLNVGEYISKYNFYQNELNTSYDNKILFIKNISSDRTELVVNYTYVISDLTNTINSFKASLQSGAIPADFYLNFGNNKIVLANNIDINPITNDILINLYEPLPADINTSTAFWVVTQIADSLEFNISITPEKYVPTIITSGIKGPNFNLNIKDQTNNSTDYIDYTTLLQIQSVSSSNQIKSLLAEKGITINIDYTDFSNFIHFSSAYQRLTNFYYKVSQIEDYNNEIITLETASPTNSAVSVNIIKDKITNIIENFDDYDYYLYYNSGSWAWPKSNNTLPYVLYSTGSQEVIDWLGSADNLTGILGSASLYDEDNQDSLYYSIPEYIRDDTRNEPYYLFIEMMGQHYDNIWTYYKDVTNLHIADNRLDYGISKDLVANALKSFGVKLYQNNFTSNDLYSALLGYTTNNSEITSSLPVTTGSFQEYINNYITASYEASVTPLDDYNKEIYKRLYHNLPYLAKTKGTIPGLRALINCFGIPDTVLRISEFGGRDKDTSTYDYFDQQFNYALNIKEGSETYITSSFKTPNSWPNGHSIGGGPPDCIQLRIKPSVYSNFSQPYSQSIFEITGSTGGRTVNLTLVYTGSGLTSPSYSGSTYDPYYQFATLTLDVKGNLSSAYTCSIYAPFFDGNWWSIMIDRSGSITNGTTDNSTFTLYAGNNLYYDGYDGNQIGYLKSSSYTGPTWGWIGTDISYFTPPTSISYPDYTQFVGQAQEIRYWAGTQSIESFKDYIMNPQSINYDGEITYANRLIFRAPLGGDLYTGSISVHPKVTGSWETGITQSFKPVGGETSDFYINSGEFIENKESRFLNSPTIGLKGRVTDKIQIVSSSFPTGSVLSQYISLEQSYPSLGSESPDVNLLEVAFSPQNEINDDIIDSLGYFNIGEYIGDPRQITSSNYPDLVNLNNDFFQKYFDSYDVFDYVRLIKYFDNSLFKMIQDFTPARTSLTSGVVIKQHILERNKYPQPQAEWEFEDYSGSLTTAFISGSTGGTFDSYNFTGSILPPTFINNTQSWGEEIKTPVGLLIVSHSTQDEFYNGELPYSEIIVSNGELDEANSLKYPADNAIIYTPTLYISNITPENNFNNGVTIPNQGEIFLWWDSGSLTNPGNTRTYYPLGARYSPSLFFSYNKTNGVKYIKLNNIDANGVDQSQYLHQLNNITLTYSDRSNVTYPIAGVQQFPGYYLYSIGPYAPGGMNNFNTSSVGEILDYTLVTNQTSFTRGTGFIYATASLTSTSDALNYFDNTTHIYTIENTPNIALQFEITASSVTTSPAGGQAGIYILTNNSSFPGATYISSTTEGAPDYVYYIAGFNVNHGSSGNYSIILSGSKALLTSSSFLIGVAGGLGVGVSISSLTFKVTPLTPTFNGSSSLVIFDPYVPNIDYNEYNALLDNADTPEQSTFFLDVDYSQNPLLPVNQSLILDNSADKAYVQDSNYSSQAWSNIRYNGSRTNSFRTS